MTLIEGIGDEVVQFVGLLVVVAVAALAWWSTNSQPGRYQTIVVMRTRLYHPGSIRNRIRQLSGGNSQPLPAPPVVPPLMDRSGPGPDASETGITVDGPVRFRQIVLRNPTPPGNQAPTPNTATSAPRAAPAAARSSGNSSRVFPILEMDNILDAHMAMVDEDRLHFYRRMDPPRRAAAAAEPAPPATSSDEQVREMEHIVSAMETDNFPPSANNSGASLDAAKTPKTEEKINNNEEASASNMDTPDDNETSDNGANASATSEPENENIPKINIRLKYMNDSFKEVEGSLDELLKDFKWRHFSTELSSALRVRLIFNGRVLADEAATLRALGLHHRAVVHCSVQPAHTDAQARSPGSEPAEAAGGRAPAAEPERAWDLDNVLMTLVSVALTVVWFFRCEYSNMFTASASVALFGLTVFYSVAIFGLYLSDTFHFDRRPAQPAPIN